MKLHALVGADRVRVDVAARSKKHAIELASELLATAYTNMSSNTLFDALIARERLGCTTLGQGVALPHAALPSVDTSAAAVIKLIEPIAFDDDDDAAVSLIVAMAIPSKTQSADNDELAQVCQLLSNGEHRRQLLAAQTPAQLYAALRSPPPESNLKEALG